MAVHCFHETCVVDLDGFHEIITGNAREERRSGIVSQKNLLTFMLHVYNFIIFDKEFKKYEQNPFFRRMALCLYSLYF